MDSSRTPQQPYHYQQNNSSPFTSRKKRRQGNHHQPRPPDTDQLRGVRGEEGEGEVREEEGDIRRGGGEEEEEEEGEEEEVRGEEEEDKMPPKMRKRWMHREAVALREMNGTGSALTSSSSSTSGRVELGIHGLHPGEGDAAGMDVDVVDVVGDKDGMTPVLGLGLVAVLTDFLFLFPQRRYG